MNEDPRTSTGAKPAPSLLRPSQIPKSARLGPFIPGDEDGEWETCEGWGERGRRGDGEGTEREKDEVPKQVTRVGP